MAEELPFVIGRSKGDVKKYGTKGAIFLGTRYVEEQGRLLPGPNAYMDVSGAHVVFICGKRGGGKSYTMGVIAEGFHLLEPEVRARLSIILIDTMGVYWTMTHPNKEEWKLLGDIGLKPMAVPIRIFTPFKFYEEYKKKGIPTDYPFSIKAGELDSDDWIVAFHQDKFQPNGVIIEDVVSKLKDEKGNDFEIDHIIAEVKSMPNVPAENKIDVVGMFEFAKSWGIFSKESTDIQFLAKGGEITVLDVSCYATTPGGWDVKSLAVGLVAKHLFVQRMLYRKGEEYDIIKKKEAMFRGIETKTKVVAKKPIKPTEDMPLVWLVVDEAHEFLPKEAEDANAATMPLIEIMREGRQPGICLILATQQPGKIHTDVMTQSDIVLSHRITADIDIKALGLLAQSFERAGLTRAMESLPRLKGTAVVFDDLNEAYYQIRVRPRFSWHGGASPSALRK